MAKVAAATAVHTCQMIDLSNRLSELTNSIEQNDKLNANYLGADDWGSTIRTQVHSMER